MIPQKSDRMGSRRNCGRISGFPSNRSIISFSVLQHPGLLVAASKYYCLQCVSPATIFSKPVVCISKASTKWRCALILTLWGLSTDSPAQVFQLSFESGNLLPPNNTHMPLKNCCKNKYSSTELMLFLGKRRVLEEKMQNKNIFGKIKD